MFQWHPSNLVWTVNWKFMARNHSTDTDPARRISGTALLTMDEVILESAWSPLGPMRRAQNAQPSTDAPVVTPNSVRIFNIYIYFKLCMLHDKVFCHYYLGKYLIYAANHAFLKLTVSKELKNVKQAKYGDIIIELIIINIYEWFLWHMMSSYGYL